nr:uncharacterized protein LOC109167347 [Ipomoea batatas]
MKRSEISSQRYAEDADLLERSTKKSKEGMGSADDMESDSEACSPSSTDHVMDPVGLETPSSDLPVGDPPVLNEQLEASVPLTGIAAGQASHAAPPVGDSGVTRPRSYLDSVVGKGADAAPFLIDEVADVNEPNTEESCPTVTAEGGAAATDGTENPNPMGPTVGGVSEGQRSHPAAAKETVGATGSRFNPLETEEESGPENAAAETRELHADTENPEKSDGVMGPPQSASQARLEGRQRRSNVIANEKQIANEPNPGRRSSAEVGETSGQSHHRRGPRRAAEEDEHVVNRGEDGGNVIRTTTVSTQELAAVVPAIADTETPEHHADPPEGLDAEGDVVMEDDISRESVRTASRVFSKSLSRFKFQAAWFTHKGLTEVIKSSWNSSHLFTENVPRLTETLSSWNKSTFENINHRKRITMARIEGVQRRLVMAYHGGLAKLEKKLIQEYQDILYQEKARNTVTCLRTDTGVWLTKGEDLRTHIREYFTTIFTEEQRRNENENFIGMSPDRTFIAPAAAPRPKTKVALGVKRAAAKPTADPPIVDVPDPAPTDASSGGGVAPDLPVTLGPSRRGKEKRQEAEIEEVLTLKRTKRSSSTRSSDLHEGLRERDALASTLVD